MPRRLRSLDDWLLVRLCTSTLRSSVEHNAGVTHIRISPTPAHALADAAVRLIIMLLVAAMLIASVWAADHRSQHGASAALCALFAVV